MSIKEIDDIILQQLRCEKVRSLGNGCFGRVYLVKHNFMECCLKIVKKHNFLESEFTIATCLMMKSRSQNVIEYISKENIFVEGVEYVALFMEFVNGGNILKHFHFPRTTELNKKDEYLLFSFAKQLFGGLAAIHDKHMIHGNLKANNILVAKNGSDDPNELTLKISDFVLAKYTILSHMPPETFDYIKQFTELVDVWSAGIVVFNLVYGHYPVGLLEISKCLRSFNIAETLQRESEKILVPEWLKNVLQMCLVAKETRKQSSEILAFLTGQSIKHPSSLSGSFTSSQPPLYMHSSSFNLWNEVGNGTSNNGMVSEAEAYRPSQSYSSSSFSSSSSSSSSFSTRRKQFQKKVPDKKDPESNESFVVALVGMIIVVVLIIHIASQQ